MYKKEYIARYGEAAYERMLEQARQWGLDNPDRVREVHRQYHRKGGKFYLRKLNYDNTGIRKERNKVRNNHRRKWREYKRIIAPNSQLHHQWKAGESEYDGVALVEANQHRQGIIDVIQIVEGEITPFTEEEVRNRGDIGCQ